MCQNWQVVLPQPPLLGVTPPLKMIGTVANVTTRAGTLPWAVFKPSVLERCYRTFVVSGIKEAGVFWEPPSCREVRAALAGSWSLFSARPLPPDHGWH